MQVTLKENAATVQQGVNLTSRTAVELSASVASGDLTAEELLQAQRELDEQKEEERLEAQRKESRAESKTVNYHKNNRQTNVPNVVANEVKNGATPNAVESKFAKLKQKPAVSPQVLNGSGIQELSKAVTLQNVNKQFAVQQPTSMRSQKQPLMVLNK